MRVLVTGASGFVGAAVIRQLQHEGHQVHGATRRTEAVVPVGIERMHVQPLAAETDWSEALAAVDVVVHTAARVHVMNERLPDPLAEYRRINVDGTRRLAQDAQRAGVRRLVFLSSVKVNGESTRPGLPFTVESTPAPLDPYGVSKLEAEEQLRAIAASAAMDVVIIRPVLVYGPGVRGNFRTLLRWLQAGVPLPLGAVHNRRSLIALDNLVDLIMRSISHPDAARQTLFASDDDDLATPELLQRAARAMGRRARLIPVPVPLLRATAGLVGQDEALAKLVDSLQVDIASTRTLLRWTPPVVVDDALASTARHFLGHDG